jgi:protein SCO1/2
MPTLLRFFAAGILAVVLISCGGSKPAAPAKEYKLDGVIVRLDAQVRTAVIKHQKIEGWMEAMTMEFPVREPKEFEKLAPGKHITATVYVTDDGYWIGNIAVL